MTRLIGLLDRVAEEKIGKNSAVITNGDFLTLQGADVAGKTGTSGVIDMIALETRTFASDNQTVALKTILGLATRNNRVMVRATADADIATADIDFLFTLNADQTVDVATKSTSAGQLKLKAVIAPRLGEFEVIN